MRRCRIWLALLGVVVCSAAGCCRICDRWCGRGSYHPYPPACYVPCYPAPANCYPPPVNACTPNPCAPAAPGVVGGYPPPPAEGYGANDYRR